MEKSIQNIPNRYTYGFFCEMLCSLIEVLRGHDPNVGMVTEHQKTLFCSEHDAT